MKLLLAVMLLTMFSVVGWSQEFHSHHKTTDPIKFPTDPNKIPDDIKNPPKPGNDSDNNGDVIPWPWGKECPFLWDKVDGAWQVKGQYGQNYDRDTLVFETEEKVKEGLKILYIYHYELGGRLIGQGTGFSDSDNKIIKAIMTNVDGHGASYTILVHTFAPDQARSCRAGKLAMAVTFCSKYGSQCLKDQNYLLVK
jgi:hypothetical protein